MSGPRPVAVFAMEPGLQHRLFSPEDFGTLGELVNIDPSLALACFDRPAEVPALTEAEILITGWGCSPIDHEALRAAPRLRMVLHAAGTVRHHVTEACWDRGIVVSSAAAANALPVAEFALAAIIMAGKNARGYERLYRTRRGPVRLLDEIPAPGNYRRRIGIVGASRIGRRLIELLRPLDVAVSVSDPYLPEREAADLGVRSTTLAALMSGSDVVTLHAPALPSTRHMIDPVALASMRDGATLINTARGSLVDQEALIAELVTGRISAVLDVTEPEVLPRGCPLYTLPNVVLTPHIAGSLGGELHRFGATVVAELRRHVAGDALEHRILPADLERIA